MKTKGLLAKPHHHVNVDADLKLDCLMWIEFIKHQSAVCRPFVDFDANTFHADELRFFSRSSGSKHLGYGVEFEPEWCHGLRGAEFI